MKKYPHFHENKPTVSENVNFAGSAGYSEEARIFITKKKIWKNDLTLMWKLALILLLI